MAEKIKFLPVRELDGRKFQIPNYQRGYRWERQQVRDLLNDIKEFMDKPADVRDDFYSLQPLVVREQQDAEIIDQIREAKSILEVRQLLKGRWEVIDGQQRLTTIHILLSYLKNTGVKFELQYETRAGSASFLENIANETKEDPETNIDFWHMQETYEEIQGWFKWFTYNSGDVEKFKEMLLDKVRFIWYEADEDPIKVFTRINIGKIGLTNSELIKALFLNSSNFAGDDAEKIRLRQIEIASQWDRIETTLQDDEFWMFLHKSGFNKPTRIDFIFDLICELGALDKFLDGKDSDDKNKVVGKDDYRTFRYFNAVFHSSKIREESGKIGKAPVEICWEKAEDIFAAFGEWFDDLQLYHYVGFLVEQNTTIKDIYKEWLESETKPVFINYLIGEIKKRIAGCSNLDCQYETVDENGKNAGWKSKCLPLLLLYNLQTVINQNLQQDGKNHSGVFYKFPFHLYKKEGWDIEHIDSNTTNDLDDRQSKAEYLANIYSGVSGELQESICRLFDPENSSKFDENFEELKKRTEKELGSVDTKDLLNEEEKNRVWNFALLDSHTNRGYGNAIFSAKRRIIIGKDEGKYLPVPRPKKDVRLEILPKEKASSAFIPPCTRHVFLKYYSVVMTSPNHWTKADAEAYSDHIFETLNKVFGVVKGEDKKNQQREYK